MLANRLAEQPVAAAVGTVTVSSGPPDRVDLSGASDPTQINVFLHQVSRNAGWSTVEAPARDRRGARIAAPPLALDLHYLVSAYGTEPLHAEVLLAQAAQVFHETPVPGRAVIERALNPSAPPAGFPSGLAGAGLADQVEALRITFEAMSNEEISKLWSALQARYRPTIALRVTTVLIDSDLTARPALPTRAAQVGVTAPARPMIAAVRPEDGPASPVLPGTRLVIDGTNLAAPEMELRVGGVDLTDAIAEAATDRIVLALPDPLPAGLRAGAAAVTVLHLSPLGEPPVLRETAVSNPGLAVIRPSVTATFTQRAERVANGLVLRDGTIRLTLTPPAGRRQRITLLLNATDGSGRGYGLRAPDANGLPPEVEETATVDIPVTDLAAGIYLLRVQVEAGESVLTTDAEGRFTGPTVTI